MVRRTFALLLAASGAFALRPEPVAAQLTVDVHLFWRSGDDGVWRPHRYAPPPRGGAYVIPLPVRYGPAPAVRIPPGHLPPPGACRLWYPGRPPGHQPPPTSCGRLFRSGPYHGAIIVGSPGYRGPGGYGAPSYYHGPAYGGAVYDERGYRYDGYDRYERYDRYDRYDDGYGSYERYDRDDEGWERGRKGRKGGPPGPPRGRGNGRGRGG